MRVAVVGTSNSVRKDGYVPQLAGDPRVSRLSNYSLGASTSLISIPRMENVDFSRFDFCLIDFSVNEEVLRKNGGLDLDLCRDVVESLVVRCLAARCLPVFALLPRMIATESAQMRTFYRDLARTMNVPVIDGYDLVDGLLACSDVTRPGMFIDKSHIRPWVAGVFAQTLADGLAGLFAKEDRFVDEPVTAPRFRAVDVSEQIEPSWLVERVNRSNGLVTLDFLRSEVPTKLRFDVQGADLVGMYVNLKATDVFVSFASGADHVLIDLRNKFFDDEEFEFIVSALPLRRRLPIVDGSVEMRSFDSEGVSAFGLAHDIKGELGRVTRPASGRIEIAKLLVAEREAMTSPFASAQSNRVDIVAAAHPDGFRRATEAFRQAFPIEGDHLFEAEHRQKNALRTARTKRLTA